MVCFQQKNLMSTSRPDTVLLLLVSNTFLHLDILMFVSIPSPDSPPALTYQNHEFTIGTELMGNTEEDVRNDSGIFYTFPGYEVRLSPLMHRSVRCS